MDPQRIASSPVAGAAVPPRDGSGQATTDTTLSDILQIVRKRKWIIAAALILGGMYGLYKGSTQPRIYDAYGLIEIRKGSSDQYRVSATSPLGSDSSNRMPAEVTILQSDTLLLSVARDLDLANNPYFGGSPTQRRSIDDPSVRQGVLGALLGSLHIVSVPKTDIIRISCDTLNAQLSADIVNTVIKDYIDHTLEARGKASERVTEWLSRRLIPLKQEVEKSQNDVLDLQRKLGVLGFDSSHNQITISLDDLTRAAASAEVTRILAESRYRVLSTASPDTLGSSVDAV